MKEIQLHNLETLLIEANRDMSKVFEDIHKKAMQGSFINLNSSTIKEKTLYRFIDNNFGLVKNYFKLIGFELIKDGHKGYCYFASSNEEDNSRNLTLANYLKILDYLPFLLTADANFGIVKNYEFTASGLEQSISNNVELKDLIGKSKKTNREYIDMLIRDFRQAGYIEELNSKEGRYLVLNSIDYIMSLNQVIAIDEDNND